MANYYATARSNYFRVRDEKKFKAWVDSLLDVGLWERDELPRCKYFAIYSDCPDSGSWPSCRYDEEADEYVDIDLVDELSEHLAEGSVAVLMEVGAEKMRYTHGHAVAVDSEGEVCWISLGDIYAKAKARLGGEITPAEY